MGTETTINFRGRVESFFTIFGGISNFSPQLLVANQDAAFGNVYVLPPANQRENVKLCRLAENNPYFLTYEEIDGQVKLTLRVLCNLNGILDSRAILSNARSTPLGSLVISKEDTIRFEPGRACIWNTTLFGILNSFTQGIQSLWHLSDTEWGKYLAVLDES